MIYVPTTPDLELAVLYSVQLNRSASEAIRLMVEVREQEMGVPLEVFVDHALIGRFWYLKSQHR